ncbi:hypothetical protein HY968_05275 [Candidatus Kaiserbacteria bacterium]|nr:hypothetical protein [Candidatus Kaiserbacteria bacterium]
MEAPDPERQKFDRVLKKTQDLLEKNGWQMKKDDAVRTLTRELNMDEDDVRETLDKVVADPHNNVKKGTGAHEFIYYQK